MKNLLCIILIAACAMVPFIASAGNHGLTAQIVGSDTICAGNWTFLTVVTNAPCTNCSYLWTPTTALQFTGTDFNQASPTTTTTYTVRVIKGVDTAFATFKVRVGTYAPPRVYIFPNGGNNACPGRAAFRATWANANPDPLSPNAIAQFEWYKNNVLVKIDSAPSLVLPSSNPAVAGDRIHCVMTPLQGCAHGVATISNNLYVATCGTMTVPNVTYNICPGTTPVPITVTGGTGSYNYSWAPDTTLNCYYCAQPTATVTATKTYTVTVTDGAQQKTSTVTLNVSSSATPPTCSITNASTAGPTCGAGTAPLTGTYANAGINPVLKWYRNDSLIRLNTTTLNVAAIPGDTIRFTVVSSNKCSVPDSISSFIVFTTPDTVHVTIAATTALCSDAPTKFTATATNLGTTATYTWAANSTPLGTSTINTYTTTSVPYGANIWVSVSTNKACTLAGKSQMIQLFNCSTMVATTKSLDSICNGSSKALVSTVSKGTTNYTYKWSPSTGLTCDTCAAPIASPTVTTTYTLIVTDGQTSDTLQEVMKVLTNGVSSMHIVSTPYSQPCLSYTVFKLDTVNVGRNHYPTWYVNNVVKATTDTFKATNLAVNDVVKLTIRPDVSCPATVLLIDSLKMPAMPAFGVTMTTSPSPLCTNRDNLITVHPTGGGIAPTYSLYIDGQKKFTTASTSFHTGVLTNLQTVEVEMVASSEFCVQSSHSTYTPSVRPVTCAAFTATISGDSSICNGTSSTLKVTAQNGTPPYTYRWTPSTGLSCVNCTTTVASPTSNTNYVVTVKDAIGNTIAGNFTLEVNDSMIGTVALVTDPVDPCDGAQFITANTTDAGVPILQWYLNGSAVNVNHGRISADNLLDGDQVYCTMVSGLECAAKNTITSNAIDVLHCHRVGIEQYTLNKTVSVYPNPNNGHFILKIDQSGIAMNIEITSIQGLVLYKDNVNPQSTLNKEYDLSNMAKGLYLMRITSENGVVVKRIILQ